ncbi:MAG: LptE family protein [Planctomycetaceae bacterium]|nr:LptE family protein [Planctomycetaceae bacterium]
MCNNQTFPEATRCGRRSTMGLMLIGLMLPGCSGYMVGGAYAPDIRTVHVPTFTTDSYRRGFELQLTEAVQKQIQSRTPYRLTKGPGADTRLTGHIVEVRKDVLTETKFDDPRELQLSLAVEVRWEDLRTGQVLSSRQMPLSGEAVQLIAHSEYAPEVGHSLATATQDVTESLARQIVGMMEVPW